MDVLSAIRVSWRLSSVDDIRSMQVAEVALPWLPSRSQRNAPENVLQSIVLFDRCTIDDRFRSRENRPLPWQMTIILATKDLQGAEGRPLVPQPGALSPKGAPRAQLSYLPAGRQAPATDGHPSENLRRFPASLRISFCPSSPARCCPRG